MKKSFNVFFKVLIVSIIILMFTSTDIVEKKVSPIVPASKTNLKISNSVVLEDVENISIEVEKEIFKKRVILFSGYSTKNNKNIIGYSILKPNSNNTFEIEAVEYGPNMYFYFKIIDEKRVCVVAAGKNQDFIAKFGSINVSVEKIEDLGITRLNSFNFEFDTSNNLFFINSFELPEKEEDILYNIFDFKFLNKLKEDITYKMLFEFDKNSI